MIHRTAFFATTAASALILFSASAAFAAWTGPTLAAPNGNTAAPINVSGTSQVKAGGLWAASIGSDSGYCIGASCITAWPFLPSGSFFYTTSWVGIGTSTPGSLLSLGGIVNFTSATSTFYSSGGINIKKGCFAINGVCIGATGPAGATGPVGPKGDTGPTGPAGNTSWTLSGVNQYSNNTGNVGIGDTAPAYKLDVTGSIHATSWMRTDGSTGWYSQTWGSGFYMSDAAWIRGYSPTAGLWMKTGNIGTDGGLTVGYGGAGVAAGGAIIAGNVGIGTASPSARFDVSGNFQVASNGVITLKNNVPLTVKDSAGIARNLLFVDTSNIVNIGDGSVFNKIYLNGNVGIGTASPAETLDVAGNVQIASTAPVLYFNETDQIDPLGWWRMVANGGVWSLRRRTAAGTWVGEKNSIIINSAGDVLFQDGNVGIGTTSPASRLAVNGDVYATGNVTAAGYFHSSDARLKTNVATSGGLEIVKKLRGVTFDWKKDGAPSAGVIAQEVEQVLPSAVHTDENGMKTVEYDQLIAPLIEAIKEQQYEIEGLKHEVSALKAGQWR